MPMVPWTVELNADPDISTIFIINDSLLGGTDLLASDDR
jgi:hypothetical protein